LVGRFATNGKDPYDSDQKDAYSRKIYNEKERWENLTDKIHQEREEGKNQKKSMDGPERIEIESQEPTSDGLTNSDICREPIPTTMGREMQEQAWESINRKPPPPPSDLE